MDAGKQCLCCPGKNLSTEETLRSGRTPLAGGEDVHPGDLVGAGRSRKNKEAGPIAGQGQIRKNCQGPGAGGTDRTGFNTLQGTVEFAIPAGMCGDGVFRTTPEAVCVGVDRYRDAGQGIRPEQGQHYGFPEEYSPGCVQSAFHEPSGQFDFRSRCPYFREQDPLSTLLATVAHLWLVLSAVTHCSLNKGSS